MKYLLLLIVLFSALGPVLACAADPAPNNLEEDTGFRFLEIEWADEITGYGDYVVNKAGVFQRGTRAYVYMEIGGYESLWDEEKRQYYTDVSIDVALRSQGGLRLFAQENVVDYVHWDPHVPASLWFYIWVDIPGWIPRTTYTAQVTIHDRVGEQTLEKAQELSVQ